MGILNTYLHLFNMVLESTSHEWIRKASRCIPLLVEWFGQHVKADAVERERTRQPMQGFLGPV